MRLSLSVSSLLCLAESTYAVDPDAVYDGGYNSTNATIELRIGNGGAGQSGLIKGQLLRLLRPCVRCPNNPRLQSQVKNNGSTPFKVAWYKSDTTESINYLQSNAVDIGITYKPRCGGG